MRKRKQFWLIKRGKVFYALDSETRKRVSLNTSDLREAEQLVNAKNVVEEQPALNLALAKVHLAGADPMLAKRSWGDGCLVPS
jgi:hypothetical protein